jgi:hypothetical protein
MNQKIKVTLPIGMTGYPVISLYADGSTRLDLRDCEDHSPLATCTSNCVTYVEPDCIIVKDYSENTGMANALYDAGVVTGTVRKLEAIRWGGVEHPVMRLHPDLAAIAIELKEQFNSQNEEDND